MSYYVYSLLIGDGTISTSKRIELSNSRLGQVPTWGPVRTLVTCSPYGKVLLMSNTKTRQNRKF